MARRQRLLVPDIPVHVVQRGNNRTPVFVDDADRAYYRLLLAEGCTKLRCEVHAYVLMNNHVHLLLTPADAHGVSRLMQWIGRHYVRRFNRRSQRTGTLWEGRFHSSVIDSARYFLACCRYIDQNPVRAGIAATPSAYRWSSHARLAHGRPDVLVREHAEYLALDATATARQAAYRALCAPAVEVPLAREIRRAVKRGDTLGTPEFIADLQARLQRPVRRAAHGGDRKRMPFTPLVTD